MKIKVIACGVFEPELTELSGKVPSEVHLHFLDAGLHSTPNVLRERVQEAIDAAEGQGYDAIVVAYGLCGRGTSGLVARDTMVVLPRVHDCMTLFLGSRAEYRRQFQQHPGTFYTTPGWYEKKLLFSRGARDGGGSPGGIARDPRYADFSRRFGEDNAEAIIQFYDSWKRNYTRAAFIDTGIGNRELYAGYAREMAEEFGWVYEALPGDTSLLRRLLAGEFEDPGLFVLEPGQRSTLTGDDGIFAAIDIAGPEPAVACPARSGCAETVRPVPTCAAFAPEPDAADEGLQVVGLGIDAGGTYTDCVLYDLRTQQVLSKAKALTTHHDLLLGIDEALDALQIPEPQDIGLVALSTTLATNSIVEGKGGTPGAIILASGLASEEDIDWRPTRFVRGRLSIAGVEQEPVDEGQIAAVVDELLAAGVDAFAVSGYASVKSPAHELAIRQVIRTRSELPVVCGHELSSRLNFISRANTAILNARLLPVVRRLIEAVRRSLEGRGICATITVVKGDGSLVNCRTALERPIETILSGPAASVSGAKHLTGIDNAIILDMGGTTTDTAVIEDGLARISPEGARVGGWLTSVEAADISTTGLGGDSHLDFTVDRRLLVGPGRVVPLCYLCHRHPAAAQTLMALDPSTILDRSGAAALEFFVLSVGDDSAPLDAHERAIVAALKGGPLTRVQLAGRVGAPAPSLLRTRRLEELGILLRSGLTPTDILHVSGEFRAWDVAASAQGLRLFAELYGATPEQMVRQVRELVVRRLAGEIMQRELPDIVGSEPARWPSVLREAFADGAKSHLKVTLSYGRPIIAIGAPVEPFFPEVGRRLGAEVVIPRHAEVANAIGAIASEVVVRERAVVRPGDIANFVVYTRAGRREHETLLDAVEAAKAEAASLARSRALAAGTASEKVRHSIDERRAFSAEGEEVLIEVLVEATVSGRPQLAAAT